MIAGLTVRTRVSPLDLIATAERHPTVFAAIIATLNEIDDADRQDDVRSKLRAKLNKAMGRG